MLSYLRCDISSPAKGPGFYLYRGFMSLNDRNGIFTFTLFQSKTRNRLAMHVPAVKPELKRPREDWQWRRHLELANPRRVAVHLVQNRMHFPCIEQIPALNWLPMLRGYLGDEPGHNAAFGMT